MTSTPRTLAALAFAVLSLAGRQGWAENNFQLDPERIGPRNIVEGTPWKEGPVALPPWPRDSDLVEWVPDGPRTDFRYFVDAANLRVDTPGAVVRYTLVVEAPSGTRNLSFEGIRCTLQGQYRTYAYGVDRRFERAPPSEWLPISAETRDAARSDLFRYRFCVPRETRPRPVKDMLRALRGHVSANESTGFQAD